MPRYFELKQFVFPFLGKRPDVESVILCGIETHACIHHTTLELIEKGIHDLLTIKFSYFIVLTNTWTPWI